MQWEKLEEDLLSARPLTRGRFHNHYETWMLNTLFYACSVSAGFPSTLPFILRLRLFYFWVENINIVTLSLCLKTTFNFASASKASYVYILSGQKFMKNAKKVQFGEILKTWSLRSYSVTGQVNFNGTKIGEKGEIKMRHFGQFSKKQVAL